MVLSLLLQEHSGLTDTEEELENEEEEGEEDVEDD